MCVSNKLRVLKMKGEAFCCVQCVGMYTVYVLEGRGKVECREERDVINLSAIQVLWR